MNKHHHLCYKCVNRIVGRCAAGLPEFVDVCPSFQDPNLERCDEMDQTLIHGAADKMKEVFFLLRMVKNHSRSNKVLRSFGESMINIAGIEQKNEEVKEDEDGR